MALDGAHAIGETGHVADHNDIDAQLGFKALKAETLGVRRRTGGASPPTGAWEARPSGYALVVAIGIDPSPSDQQAGDIRWVVNP